jgi:hypothetical protein
MKKLITIAALVGTVISAPAFAATSAMAATHSAAAFQRNSDVVVDGGRVIGQDPDANVRSMIERDPFPGND